MDSWTPVLKIDAEAEINRYWFVSVDIHEPYLEKYASGVISAPDATDHVTLNPLRALISIGQKF